jgi:sulfite reductase alpha subunit-like flavoprotein
VLRDFPSLHGGAIPFDHVFDLFRLLQARSFSIASSPLAHPRSVHLTVAIVRFENQFRWVRTGICTGWLAELPLGSRVRCWIVPGTLRLPEHSKPPMSPDSPVIMVGPGTGCAPFRSMIEHRHAVRMAGTAPAAPTMMLFFGCRRQAADFLHADDWRRWESAGELVFFAAFSRDTDRKVYVQDKIREHGQLVWQWISERGAAVYIAGNARKMPDDVRLALRDVALRHGGMTVEAADAWVSEFENRKRLQVEAWS